MTTPIKFNANGHFYQYINTPTAGNILFNGFNFGTYRGLQGYLSTVTSSAENSLIGSLISVNPDAWVYLGGTDSAVESEWKWAGGPEAGVLFWKGYTKVIPGSAVNGAYTNWMTDHLDPVNGQFEHYLVARTSNTLVNGNPLYYEAGAWADSSANNAYGYVVEFGGLPETYNVTSSVTNVNEGETVTFQISTTNVEWDTLLTYVISGISSTDISSGSLSGTVLVNPDGDKGTASVTLRLTADQITEGTETLTFSLQGKVTTVVINDSSRLPTYTISASSTSVNEGSVVVFTLTTTNLTAGTSVPFTLSGISAQDISGSNLISNSPTGVSTGDITSSSINGVAVINANGVATISLNILNDSLTEGPETLTINAGGASVSTVINDTSQFSSVPTYTLANTSVSFNEGGSASFTLSTTNVANGTSIPYSISGVSSADVSGGKLTGTAFIHDGIASIYIPLVNDALTEGLETLTVSAGGASASTIVNDTSKTPTYSLKATNSSINEGSTATFTVNTTNIAAGASVLYTLSGVSGVDVSSGYLVGSTTIDANGQGTISIPLLNDTLTEGAETLTVKIGNGVSIPDYSVIGEFNEYAWVRYYSATNTYVVDTVIVISPSTVKTSTASSPAWAGQAPGFWVARNVGGVDAGIGRYYDPYQNIFSLDIPPVPVSGDFVTTSINDTSKAPGTPSYALSVAAASVNEGASAVFTLTTTNLASGTSVPYTLSGISSADISGGSLSGNAIINASGIATVSVTLLNDLLTEGDETLTITAGGSTASSIINDTSLTAASYTLQQWPAGTSVNEGSQANFSVTTTNYVMATLTLLSYTISGLSAADVGTGSLNGTVTVGRNGVIAIPIVADSLTEGAETLTVTLQGQSSSIIINDTSTSTNSKIENHKLTVLVDKGVLGPMPFFLKELDESLTYVNGVLTKHSIQYSGINFDYDLIDSLITTVTRDGEFTAEFTKEINDYVQVDANISYKVAVALVGAANIDSVIIMVAGSDGNYVN
jgi:hypothetical protein